MSRDIANYVKKCPDCLLNKPKMSTKQPLKITETPQKPFDIVAIDTIGPLPETEKRYKYAMTAICELTKYLITVPLENQEAKSITRAMFEHVILVYGPVKTIKTDRGTEYMNAIVKELCEMLNRPFHTKST